MLDVRFIIQLYSGAQTHGDKYGNGSLFASAQRGKINNTWQPPKHDVFNEASEVRCDPRGKLDRVRESWKYLQSVTRDLEIRNPSWGLIQADSIIDACCVLTVGCQGSTIAKDSVVMEPTNINQ
ncbi:hypothetical protein EDD17DRAFT_1511324 [Pisolithus thermaeus]|nr:hypothetical protein EDD17DRAFT_1511324 [Pisolithus thermaeus]